MIVIDADDWGTPRKISDQCRSNDCRDLLDKLHDINPAFKITLFAIPNELTIELLDWAIQRASYIELAQHGFGHGSNYECEKITYDEFDALMNASPIRKRIIDAYFVKGFRSPGWQTSPAVFEWLRDNGWWISCQDYDLHKLPKDLPAFVNHNNEFRVHLGDKISDVVPTSHHHTWSVGWNGIEEQWEYLCDLVKNNNDFRFISEVIHENS